jgi:hypothetical protein
MIRHLLATTAMGLALVAAAPGGAQAAFIATIQEVGSDVVVNGSGTINLSALGLLSTGVSLTGLQSARPFIRIGPATNPSFATYRFVTTTPDGFGASFAVAAANFGSGDVVGASVSRGFGLINGFIDVPLGYVSGAALASSMTFSGTTLAALDVAPGSYVWSWGSLTNSSFDTFTVNVLAPSPPPPPPPPPPTPVPAPPALALFGVGLVGLLVSRRRRF